MNNSTMQQAQLLLSQLDNLSRSLRIYVEDIGLNTQDPSVLEDIDLVTSYADQLRQAIETGSLKEALRASNGARSINKGFSDRVWTGGQRWIQDQSFEILQQSIRLHTLLVEDLGGFEEAYPS